VDIAFPLKIVFITTSLNTGGAEMMLLKLLQHIDRHNFDPYVISLRAKGEIGPQIEALGIPVLPLNMAPGLLALQKLPELIRKINQISPNLVQTWMHHADLLGGIAARLIGCRNVIWGLRQSNLSKEKSKRSSLAVLWACSMLSRWIPHNIISCSIRAKQVHESVGYPKKTIHVIPNGFDLENFRPNLDAKLAIKAELGLSNETRLVGLMARYDPMKNHAGFIAAASHVHQVLPHVHFLLAGAEVNADNHELNQVIEACGMSSCMHLLGLRNDMPSLLASIDVLVSSSSYGEAFPNILGEAMACGVPCVVTDVGDSAEIVGDTGRVVQVGDIEGLGKHIVELMGLSPEQKLDLAKQTRKRIESNYEISHVANIYWDYYRKLIKEN
jgi:glycosyltransferase involved in cell wall biosynthesis